MKGSASVPLRTGWTQDQVHSDAIMMCELPGGVRAGWSAGDTGVGWRRIQVVKSAEPGDGGHQEDRREEGGERKAPGRFHLPCK